MNQEIEVEGQPITIDNWQEIFSIASDKYGHDNMLALDIMLNFSICPIPFFTQFSVEALKAYQRLNGLGNIDYYKLQEYPNLYVEAVDHINAAREMAVKHYGNQP
ncbi:MAG: hypothetical protein PVJ60_00630 [Phycisphaerales bacterium]